MLFALNDEQKLLKCSECGLVFNDRCRTDFTNVYNTEYYETSKKESAGGYFSYDNMESVVKKMPDVESFWFKILKSRRPGIHHDCHNIYFSSKTIKLMSQKCGFMILSIKRKHFFI